MQKTVLFVDGSNLYAGQFELVGPQKYLDFARFVEALEQELVVSFLTIYCYASYSPQPEHMTDKAKQYLKNEAFFYRSFCQLKNVVFFKGYRSKTSGKEKEVDVKLATDLVHFAHLNVYDHAVFISGDADFLRALQIVVSLKKRVTIVAIQNRIPIQFLHRFPTIVACCAGHKLKPLNNGKVRQFILPDQAFRSVFGKVKEMR